MAEVLPFGAHTKVAAVRRADELSQRPSAACMSEQNKRLGPATMFQLVALSNQQGPIIRSEFIFTVPKNTPRYDIAIFYPLQTHGLF